MIKSIPKKEDFANVDEESTAFKEFVKAERLRVSDIVKKSEEKNINQIKNHSLFKLNDSIKFQVNSHGKAHGVFREVFNTTIKEGFVTTDHTGKFKKNGYCRIFNPTY